MPRPGSPRFPQATVAASAIAPRASLVSKTEANEKLLPIAVDYWNCSEFPHELLPSIGGLNIISSIELLGSDEQKER